MSTENLHRAIASYSERAAYHDGLQDGAMSVLAPALGVQPTTGEPTHTLMGRRFNITIEWIDPPLDARDADAPRTMAERALARMSERAAQWSAPSS